MNAFKIYENEKEIGITHKNNLKEIRLNFERNQNNHQI